MTIALTVNGSTYNYPETGDTQWGVNATQWALAITNAVFPKIGGNFTLTGDVNFGNSKGLILKYITSVTANPATSGTIRLANTDTIDWRNYANTGNLSLSVNNSNQLVFNTDTVAFTNVSQQFTKGEATTPITLASSGAITIDCTTSNVFYINQTGNISGWTLSNPLDGQAIIIAIKENGSGHTVAWPANFIFLSGNAINPTDGFLNIISAIYLSVLSKWVVTLITQTT